MIKNINKKDLKYVCGGDQLIDNGHGTGIIVRIVGDDENIQPPGSWTLEDIYGAPFGNAKVRVEFYSAPYIIGRR